MLAEVKTVAVICVQSFGRSLACSAAAHGYQTILKDASDIRLAHALREISDTLDHELQQGKITAEVHTACLNRLSIANTVEDAIRRGDLIIDTVHDEAEVKLELFTLFDKFALPDAILASTSSSSISITELAAVTFCPERCIGLTVHQREAQPDLVELLKGLHTSELTAAICLDFMRSIGRDCVVVSEPEPTTGDANIRLFGVQ
jgi:3-hydroxybutyryl-CoA dehydrogenase